MQFTKIIRGIAAGALVLAALGAHAHTAQNTPLEKIDFQSAVCTLAQEAQVIDASEENAFLYGECASGTTINPYRYVDPDGRDVVGIDFKNYQVDTGMGFKLPLGHAGVLLINNTTGGTKYFEYGRYDPKGAGIVGAKLPQQDGNVRKVDVPDVKIGKDGAPTPESLKKVYDSLSKTAGHGAEVQPDYRKGADEAKAEKEIMTIANDPAREKYRLLTNSCKDFCKTIVNDSSK